MPLYHILYIFLRCDFLIVPDIIRPCQILVVHVMFPDKQHKPLLVRFFFLDFGISCLRLSLLYIKLSHMLFHIFKRRGAPPPLPVCVLMVINKFRVHEA